MRPLREEKIVDNWIKTTFGPSFFDKFHHPFIARCNKLIYNGLQKASYQEKISFVHSCLDIAEKGIK